MSARVLALVVAATVLVPAVSGADPSERESTIADRERVDLTIYNGSTSLVHDRREIALAAGTNTIAWRDVSGAMDATSAILDDVASPGATDVLEQNFDYDLLQPSTVLEKYVGRDVTVVHERPAPGKPASEPATLLSATGGVVLRYRDRVETGLYESHIVFPSISDRLRDRPTLVLQLASAKPGTRALDLSYLTGGLAWHADYVGALDAREDRMDVVGLVTLENTTGTTFANAHVQLVAGNVNVAEPPSGSVMRELAATPAPAPVREENFFEYHLYTLARPTTVENAQTKQVTLLRAKSVPVRETLELRGYDSYYTRADTDLGQRLGVAAYLTFVDRGGDLGIPLPAGVFRLYERDRTGRSQFLGSDRIDHTPRDATVRLHLGTSFDVTARKKQTDFHGTGSCAADSSYAIAVANAKDVAQDVLVVEPIPGTWTIVRENVAHEKSSARTATWTLRVPARATFTLAYTAHVAYCL